MKVYLETYGCQMNEYDSKMIRAMLAEAGHAATRDPSTADAVIVNTCAVRERAERRVIGRLRHLRGLMRPNAVLGVIGCVAQRLGDELTRIVPGIDFVVGTDRYADLPRALETASAGSRLVATTPDATERYEPRPLATEAALCEFVSVMRGCDNYCSYCIVPYVRGRERSRPAERVVEEVRRLVELGARDVTLVGQNVNSYSDGVVDFAKLLRLVNDVPGLARLRFTTSHPKDLTDAIIDAVAELPQVCEHIHLPVQSGSNAVLAAMNRGYTREAYVDLVRRIRERVPGVALTTDIIVGFPGETDEHFEETLSLLKEVRFDSAFMFRYSVREGTSAARLTDDVPEETKIARLTRTIDLQKRITAELNRALVGTTLEVLVEGPSEKDPARLFGRTRTGKAVVFTGPSVLQSKLVQVRIVDASAWTLHGELEHG